MEKQKKRYNFKRGLELMCPGGLFAAAGYDPEEFKIGAHCFFLISNATGEVPMLIPEKENVLNLKYIDELTTGELKDVYQHAQKEFSKKGYTLTKNEEGWRVQVKRTDPDIVVCLKTRLFAYPE
ncbi:hypothetical protein [Negativicoccus succinicivorans]|uniref:hypothetical protein n=1 Tax=Negativicoccus succinicivorans TaxID=620903 RepID=UPI0029066E74|nr:hypothetical protein [Negativicoccus succinicivorans]MDU5288744.1 hypothetical protein [Negativicoccus succinicivorans]